jgi:hypothetical protein
MQGTVQSIGRTGLVAVFTERGEYTVFDPQGYESLEVGDQVSGNLDNLGTETLVNNSKGNRFKAFVDCIHADQATARKLLSGR